MKARTQHLRGLAAFTLAVSLTAASALTASAAPSDTKSELITAATTLGSQSSEALYAANGAENTCKTWAANSGYLTAARNSVNTIRQLAGVPALAANTALNTYAAANTHPKCTAAKPAQSIYNPGDGLRAGDPGSVRNTINATGFYRSLVLGTTTKNFALGHHHSPTYGTTKERSYYSSNSASDWLGGFSKNVAWPSAGYFPVELSNGVWSYYGKNMTANEAQFDQATVTIKNLATGANVPVQVLKDGSFATNAEAVHFKAPGATVGSTKGTETAYAVTISNTYTGSGSTKTIKAPIKYTVKLVRTGASFSYVPKAPTVTLQPASRIAIKVGQTLKISTAARVPNQQSLKLQWQIKKKGSTTWENLSVWTPTFTYKTSSNAIYNGASMRIKATSSGKTTYSSAALLSVTKYATTVKMPKHSLVRGKYPSATVKASVAGRVQATFTRGSFKYTKSVKVKKDTATIIKMGTRLPSGSGAKGTWKVTLKLTPTNHAKFANSTLVRSVTVK